MKIEPKNIAQDIKQIFLQALKKEWVGKIYDDKEVIDVKIDIWESYDSDQMSYSDKISIQVLTQTKQKKVQKWHDLELFW